MPLSGKEELGMQSSSSLTGIPIKKRRFPFVQSSHESEEPSSFRDESELKKIESGSIQRSSFNPIDATTNCASKSDASKNPLSEAKQERLGDGNVDSVQLTTNCSGSKPAEESGNSSAQSTKDPSGFKPTEADVTSIQFAEEPSASKAIEAEYVSVRSSEEPSGSKPTEANASSIQYMKESVQCIEKPSGSEPAEMEFTFSQPTKDPSGSKPAEMDFTFSQSTNDPSGSKPAETNDKFLQSSKETCWFQQSQATITSAHSNEESLGSKLQVHNAKLCSGTANSVDSCVKAALAESSIEVVENISVNVKMEIMNKQEAGDIKFQSSPHSGNAELSLGPQRQNLSLGMQNREASDMSDNLDPSLLSLSLNKEKATTQMGSSNSRSSDFSPDADADRSNWDLNTTMDAWEGSGSDFQDTDNIDTLCKIGTGHVPQPSLSSYGMTSACTDKGKQVCDASDQISHVYATFIQSSLSYKSEDSLCLSLGSTFHGLNLSKAQFCSISKEDSISHSSSPRNIMNLSSNGCGTVKKEPIDDSSKQDYTGSSNSTSKTLDSNSLKSKLTERGNMEPIEFDIKCAQKEIEKKPIKSEPMQETDQEICRTSSTEFHQSVENDVPSKESSSTLPVPLTPEKPFTSKLPTFSELSVSGELSNQSEHSVHTKEVHVCTNATEQINARMVTQNEHLTLDVCEPGALNVDGSKISNLGHANEQPRALVASGEGSLSGEQDMNISADMDEASYGSDYESDGKHAFSVRTETAGRLTCKEDDDYEDGEVREPILQSIAENLIAEGTDSIKVIDSDSHTMGVSGYNNVQSGDDEKDETTTIHQKTTRVCTKECGSSTVSEKIVDQFLEKDGSLPISKSENLPATHFYDVMPVNDTHRMHFDKAGAENRQEVSIEGVLCDGSLNASNETGVTVFKLSVEDAMGTNDGEKLNSSLVNAETPLNSNNAKDSSTVKSRIINLPRTSNSTSPTKARSNIGIPLSSRSGKERYFDVPDEKFHPSGNRGEMYADGSNKYTRERIRDRSYERPKAGFMRGRGRSSARFGRSRRDWDSERDFSFNRLDDYCFARHKRAAAIEDAEAERNRNDFDIAPDGAVLGPSRGRKFLNGGSPSFRHSSSRRLSPGGHANVGVQRHGRIPRNTSPSRCTDEDGSEVGGLGHGERFGRDLPNDMIDHSYRRDGQFVRGKKMFPTIQRRGYSRARSKSPDESQRHSPGPWSSSRRRAIEGLDDLSEMPQRRSPVMYRVDRMRSPECDYFSEDMVPRRRDSPSYAGRTSNNMRDVDEHGHPGSLPNRSPSNRLFPRNTRRADGMNRRERVDDDEYFGGPINSGRLHELRGDGGSDERRKYSERRGMARSFRPPYNNDNEKFRFHPDDGPRSFRCSSDEDAEFMERTNKRDREFDARIKNGPVSAPRRMRNIEEQEGNYRPSPQLWHGDGLKRRRF